VIIPEEKLASLKSSFPEVAVSQEAGSSYIFFPQLKATLAGEERSMDFLLCPMLHSNYTTRLFISEPIPACSIPNWTVHFILGRQWHTPSFNNVPETLPLKEILMAHLRALK